MSACAPWPPRFELQISFQILQLFLIISSPRIHVRKHKIRLRETRSPEERFTCAFFRLIEPVQGQQRHSQNHMTMRCVPIAFQSPPKNRFRFIGLALHIQQIAEPKLRWSVLSVAKVDGRFKCFSRLLHAAQMDFRHSELGEGFVIFGKCFDRLCEMVDAPSGVVLCQALHSPLIFTPGFPGYLQIAHGYRVFVLVRLRPFHRRQVKHQLQESPLDLCFCSHGIVAGFLDGNLVTTGWQPGHFEVAVVVRQNAAKYARCM